MHQAKGLDIGIDHKWNIKQPCFRVVSIWKTDKKLQYLNTRFFKARKGQSRPGPRLNSKVHYELWNYSWEGSQYSQKILWSRAGTEKEFDG